MLKTRTINNHKVKPIVVHDEKKKTLGYKLIPQMYSNIFLCAKKRSGKTTVINEILNKCTSKRTKIVFFVSTINKDKTYKEIKKKLKKRGNEVLCFESFVEGKTDNYLDDILNNIDFPDSDEDSEDEEEEEEPANQMGGMFVKPRKGRKKKKKKKKEYKYIEPEYCFIFDDLSSQLRHSSISGLLKKNRHYRSMVLISSQYIHDLDVQAIKQLDYTMVFKSFNQEKLQKLYDNLDLSIPFEQLKDMYLFATQKPYSFLYIDARQDKYRQNFNIELLPSTNDQPE